MKKIVLLSVSLVMVIGLNACRTGKKAYESGNYYQSVLLSVDKLRSSPKNKKARETLVEAYPLAVQTLELNNENLLKSNDASKWKLILANYNKINTMYEQILRSPVALELIGTPKNYYAEIENIKNKAAEETYALALSYLLKNTREDAKKAYYLFQESQSYIANYKDSTEKIEEARIMATLFVMINQDPVPANFAVSGSHFKNKIDEYLHSAESRMDFVEFYNPEEMIALGIQPSHEVVLRYQDFSVGNVFFKESTEQLTRDSVVVATYRRETSTNSTINSEPLGSGAVPESGSVTSSKTFNAKKNGDQTAEEGEGAAESKKNQNNNSNSGNDKVVICHQSNGSNPQTIEVSKSALQAHLNHGDALGACVGTENSGNASNNGNNNSGGTPGNSGNSGSTGTATGASGNTSGTGTSTGTAGNTSNTGGSTTETSGNSGSGTSGNNGNSGTVPGGAGNTSTTNTTAGSDTPNDLVNVYATVKATLVVNEKTVTSKALMSMTIYETDRAGRVIKEELFPVEHIWSSKWGYFNGDERALSPEQLEITKQKELIAPTRDETFMMLSEDFYYKITENLRAFYKNY